MKLTLNEDKEILESLYQVLALGVWMQAMGRYDVVFGIERRCTPPSRSHTSCSCNIHIAYHTTVGAPERVRAEPLRQAAQDLPQGAQGVPGGHQGNECGAVRTGTGMAMEVPVCA